MGRLYNRNAAITIAKVQRDKFFVTTTSVKVQDLRVQFAVKKSIEKQPNTCDLKISNLAPRTRAKLQTKPLNIRVEAGYDGEFERLFVGDLIWTRSRREGPDWVTQMQIGDGTRAFRHARVNRSFKSGVTSKKALEEVAKSMGLSIPKNVKDAKELLKQFTSGLTLEGPSEKEMSRILKPANMDHSIQDERLQILRKGETRVEQAIVISQDTGMVGSPEYGNPTDVKKPPVLHVKSLLNPRITAGGLIAVTSREITGNFKVIKLTHTGDTHGQPWYSDMEANPI